MWLIQALLSRFLRFSTVILLSNTYQMAPAIFCGVHTNDSYFVKLFVFHVNSSSHGIFILRVYFYNVNSPACCRQQQRDPPGQPSHPCEKPTTSSGALSGDPGIPLWPYIMLVTCTVWHSLLVISALQVLFFSSLQLYGNSWMILSSTTIVNCKIF